MNHKQKRSLKERLSSGNFLIFNLVLAGVIFGFSLAFLSFSCTTPERKNVVQAQEPGYGRNSPAPVESLSAAEGLQAAFRYVADKVLPSVVEIQTVSVQRQQVPNLNGIPWDFFFGPRDDSPRNQEREYRSQGLGSGIVVRQKGGTYYVLTNNHVVEGAHEISVVTNEGKDYKAEVVGQDERKDLALISFSTSDSIPLAELGDSDQVKVGDWAIAVGNPLGFMSSVTMGIVSYVGRSGGPGGNINDFIQTDASINQGNSGGALVNIRGEVIGINTWIASNNSAGSVGLGFAIPINNAKRSIDDLIDTGKISYGWLGVSLIEVDKDALKSLHIPEGKRGVLANQLFLNSPADKGGILPTDFITKVNGKEVQNVTNLQRMVGDLQPGQKAEFTAIRDGVEQKFTVTIELRTDEVAAQNKKLWPGVHVRAINDDIRSRMDLDENTQGIIAVGVVPESPAAVMGMQQGDIITGVNDTPVSDLASFYKALREKTGKEIWFDFTRDGNSLESPRYKR